MSTSSNTPIILATTNNTRSIHHTLNILIYSNTCHHPHHPHHEVQEMHLDVSNHAQLSNNQQDHLRL
jgi:hypothetical protein